MLKAHTQRALALILAALLLPLSPAAWAVEEEVITISTAADLEALGRQCALDAWSRGRRVVLAGDVDLSGRDFAPIPTFGGEFDGQGHTISGLRITASGSSMGLFRCLQEGSVVRDLTVSGTVAPDGQAAQVGGLAGVSRGAIQNCVFQGTVRGESAVGGIVGRNEAQGQVSGCSAAGQVLGSSATGGIAGENWGVLLKCASSASVNTASPESSDGVLSLDASLEQLTTSQDSGEDILSGHSDTGGIVGLTDGVVQSCANTGSVGYPHVGYNVGGIAGRQRGYLAGCANSGPVRGRKDVGGIAGQAEPEVALTPGRQTLERLRRELGELDGLIDRALDDTQGQGDRISQRLEAIGDRTEDAVTHSNTLLDETNRFVDGNVEELNSLSASVTAALDQLSPALDGLADAAERIEDLSDSLTDALHSLSDAGAIGFDALETARQCLGRLEQAGGDLEGAVGALRAAADGLQAAVIHRDPAAERQALSDLSAAFTGLGDALSQGGEAASSLLEIMRQALEELAAGLPDSPPLPQEPDLFPDLRPGDSQQLQAALDAAKRALDVLTGSQAQDALDQLSDALVRMGQAAGTAGKSLKRLSESVEFHWEALEGALGNTDSALGELGEGARAFSQAAASLEEAIRQAGTASGALEAVVDALQDASDIAGGIGWRLEGAFDAMRGAVDGLRRDGPVTLRPLGETFQSAGDSLYAAVNGLSQEMESLRGEMDGARGNLGDDLRAISHQTSVVTGLLLDAMEEAANAGTDTDLISDSSDADIAAVRQGKITQCVNTGSVEGDRNVGGVAGAMSIEYDLDPEDDVERFSLGATYETRAVLLENVNRGAVTAKKDCAGGLAGRMDLGAAAACQNYGPVSSTGGSYVGGVAGWSDAVIRSSYAKCVLSGREDVGGIAGWGARIYDCRAIVSVTGGTQRLGAIAGSADPSSGGINGNRFLDTGLAGIDGVSYAGAAEPADFAALQAEPDTPADFLSFTLTLLAEGETVASIPFQYGQDLSRLPLPVPPEREGSYGQWPAFDTSGRASDVTVEAVYTPWAALTASPETERGLSLALAEGRFTDQAALHVREGTRTPPVEDGQVWEVSLAGTDLPSDAQVPLRLLGPGEGGAVWQYRGGQWQTVEAAANGQYLLLTMEGLSGVYCVAPARSGWPFLLPAAGILAAAGLGGVLLSRRRRRKSPAGAAPGQSGN